MNDIYIVEKNVEKLLKGKHTFFLDSKLQKLVKRKLGNIKYNIYKSYKDSEKNIFYKDIAPNILLYEIKSKVNIRHQDIMGTLYSLGIDSSMYGDIVIINNHYYIYIIDKLENYLKNNLLMINNSKVELVNIDNCLLNNYQKEYEIIELIVSSERIDNVVAHLIHNNRDNIINKIKNKEILVNFDNPKPSYLLKIGDIISIRKYGKYKYRGIIKNTKKNNYIIRIDKYI